MLLSYPIGTQIIIKQCMKKLTENGAPGYFIHEIDEDEQDLQDISDDEEEKGNYMGRLLQSVSSTHKTGWKFSFKNVSPSTDQTDKELAVLLLEQFKEQTKWKRAYNAQSNDNTPPDIQTKIKNLSAYENDSLPLKQKDFTPDTVYTVKVQNSADVNYVPDIADCEFGANGDKIFDIVKGKDKVVVAIEWGGIVAQF